AVTVVVQKVSVQPEDGRLIDFGQRAVNALVSYGRYVGKLLWPVDLAALYPYPSLIVDETWPVGMIAVSGLLVAVMSAAAVWCALRKPKWGFVFTGWFWFVGTMVPVIGLVQVGRQSMADRYAYVPFVGLYVLMVFGVATIVRGKKAIVSATCVVAVLILFAMAVRANDQVKVWQNTETLFAHAVAVTDKNWLMTSNLAAVKREQARVLAQNGKQQEADTLLADAMKMQREAIAIYPDSPRMRAQLAGMLWQKANQLEMTGRNAEAEPLLNEAVKELTTAVERSPNDATAHRDLGMGLFLQHRNDEALEELQRAEELRPSDPDVHKQLAIVLSQMGRMTEAMSEIKKAIEIDPARESEYRGVLEAIRH
ncbi:MAG TPA: tetratricopeptide repeat protein, partial [Phycisphaerales bacterium]|nr:tetratricopeptide repeat protein [Phycisphaerales bacterium]